MARIDRCWPVLLAAAAVLVVGGVYCWQLPWRDEAVVVGQIWTPHLALGMLALGLTGFAVVAVSRLVTLHRRRQKRSWAYECAALAITAVSLAWILSVGATTLGLIAADAHFTDSRVGDRVLVVRTTTTPAVIERTTGERRGLLVRWGTTQTTARQ